MPKIDFKERYSRQIRLPSVGEQGQKRLSRSRVFIIGMGGLGSPVALYLAAAGVGHIVIADFDRVDESNLQRQIIHSQSDLGELKAASAAPVSQGNQSADRRGDPGLLAGLRRFADTRQNS